MARLWAKGLVTVSYWAYRTARHGVNLPVPQSVLDRLTQGLTDETIDTLRLRPQSASHLSVTGRKRLGMWIEFSALFRLEPPGLGDPPRSLILVPEKIQPFPVRSPMLAAIANLEGVERNGDRLRINLDRFMDEHQWGRRLPAAVRNRVRIAGVYADAQRIRLNLRISYQSKT